MRTLLLRQPLDYFVISNAEVLLEIAHDLIELHDPDKGTRIRRAHDEAEILQLVAVHDDHMHVIGLMAVLPLRLPGGDAAVHLGGDDRTEDRDFGNDKHNDLGRLVMSSVNHHGCDERIYRGVGGDLKAAGNGRISENKDIDRH